MRPQELINEHEEIMNALISLKRSWDLGKIKWASKKLYAHIEYEEKEIFPKMTDIAGEAAIAMLKYEHKKIIDDLKKWIGINLIFKYEGVEKLMEICNDIVAHNHREEIIIYRYMETN